MKKVKVNYIKIASENMYYVNWHKIKARKQKLQAGLGKNPVEWIMAYMPIKIIPWGNRYEKY